MTDQIQLGQGEQYICYLKASTGKGYHLVLLPGDSPHADHSKQLAWAKSKGGDLPTRYEQAILFRSYRHLFQPAWYWSNEQCDGGTWAWFQSFELGAQNDEPKSRGLRARAVRRIFD